MPKYINPQTRQVIEHYGPGAPPPGFIALDAITGVQGNEQLSDLIQQVRELQQGPSPDQMGPVSADAPGTADPLGGGPATMSSVAPAASAQPAAGGGGSSPFQEINAPLTQKELQQADQFLDRKMQESPLLQAARRMQQRNAANQQARGPQGFAAEHPHDFAVQRTQYHQNVTNNPRVDVTSPLMDYPAYEGQTGPTVAELAVQQAIQQPPQEMISRHRQGEDIGAPGRGGVAKLSRPEDLQAKIQRQNESELQKAIKTIGRPAAAELPDRSSIINAAEQERRLRTLTRYAARGNPESRAMLERLDAVNRLQDTENQPSLAKWAADLRRQMKRELGPNPHPAQVQQASETYQQLVEAEANRRSQQQQLKNKLKLTDKELQGRQEIAQTQAEAQRDVAETQAQTRERVSERELAQQAEQFAEEMNLKERQLSAEDESARQQAIAELTQANIDRGYSREQAARLAKDTYRTVYERNNPVNSEIEQTGRVPLDPLPQGASESQKQELVDAFLSHVRTSPRLLGDKESNLEEMRRLGITRDDLRRARRRKQYGPTDAPRALMGVLNDTIAPFIPGDPGEVFEIRGEDLALIDVLLERPQ